MFLKLCWILQLCFRQFKKDIGLANQSIEERWLTWRLQRKYYEYFFKTFSVLGKFETPKI